MGGGGVGDRGLKLACAVVYIYDASLVKFTKVRSTDLTEAYLSLVLCLLNSKVKATDGPRTYMEIRSSIH